MLASDARRDVGEGVHLAVRVGERDANLLAAVLEDEDVGDFRARGEVGVAVGPHIYKVADVGVRQRGERGFVLW